MYFFHSICTFCLQFFLLFQLPPSIEFRFISQCVCQKDLFVCIDPDRSIFGLITILVAQLKIFMPINYRWLIYKQCTALGIPLIFPFCKFKPHPILILFWIIEAKVGHRDWIQAKFANMFPFVWLIWLVGLRMRLWLRLFLLLLTTFCILWTFGAFRFGRLRWIVTFWVFDAFSYWEIKDDGGRSYRPILQLSINECVIFFAIWLSCAWVNVLL